MAGVLTGLIVLTGIMASISDISRRKIYNKQLIGSILLGIVVYSISYFLKTPQYVRGFWINVCISLAVGFIFYRYKIWAAGDAKLFIVMVFLFPYRLYQGNEKNIFPAFGILSMIFSVAFLFICIETLYLRMTHTIEKKEVEKRPLSAAKIIDFVLNYLMGYNTVLLVDHLIVRLMPNVYINSQGFIWLIHILTIMYIVGRLTEKKKKLIFVIAGVLLNMLYAVYYKQWMIGMINVKYFALVLLVIILRKASSQYNYEIISTEKAKEGMVLSYSTVMKFMRSRVKGLPQMTDETTKYRITNEEAEAIKKWQHSKYGEDQIVIVRHLPFAPFIFVGTLLFIFIKFL